MTSPHFTPFTLDGLALPNSWVAPATQGGVRRLSGGGFDACTEEPLWAAVPAS